MKKYILLFEGRTGSSLFCDMLNQHQEICFLGETLAELKDQGWNAQQEWMNDYFDPDSKFNDTRRNKADLKVLGFKIKLRDISDTEKFREFIHANDIKIVYMYRKNFIKQVLSSIRAIDLAKNDGFYNLYQSQADLIPGKYSIPVRYFNDIVLWLFNYEYRLREFLALSVKNVVFSTSYEEIVSDMQGSATNFFHHLGLTAVDVQPTMLKITSDRMADVIENYDEIKAFYKGSIFAADFEPD